MSTFGDYSKYYNLLYQDKDYKAEAQYVHRLIRQYVPDAQTVLELGCGTGRYCSELAELGYDVHGVDLSEEMLNEARTRKSEGVSFSQGDMRTVRLGKKFDVVLSLFHVMSYKTTNQDVLSALNTIKEHLLPGGVALFDYWYGPAVLTQKPEVRIKVVQSDDIEVTRVAIPEMFTRDNIVDVHYKAFVKNKKTMNIHELEECHRMRYFFETELRFLLPTISFEVLNTEEWVSGAMPSTQSWSVVKVVRLN